MTIKYIGFSRKTENARRLKLSGRLLFAVFAVLIAGCGDASGMHDGLTPHRATEADQTLEIGEPGVYESPAADQSPDVTPAEMPVPQGDRIGRDLGVTRAMAAKMLALALYGENIIDSMEREIEFTDTDKTQWYDKYINAVYIDGCMSGSEKTFTPNDPFTFEQVRVVLNRLDPDHTINLQDKGANASKAVSYELWVDIYLKLLKVLGVNGMESKNFVVMATAGNNSQLSNWYMISDIGPYRHAGLNMDNDIDKRVQALVKGKEIVALMSITDKSPVIRNAFVVRRDDETATIFSGGAERTYNYPNTLTDAPGKICDIHIDNGRALDVTVKSDNVSGIVMRTNDTRIEIGNESYERGEDFKVYSTADGPVKWKDVKDLIVGADMAVFMVDGNKACAGIITKAAAPNAIRAVLRTTGYKGLIHTHVKGTSDADYTVMSGEDKIQFKAGEIFDADALPKSGRIFIKPDNPDGTIEIQSIERNWPDGQNPRYAGTIEIGAEDGGYSIINELSLEQYLYAVVPSEMPTSYGLEAAKTQAVTARSYAYNQFYQNRFHEYGANVDDSVNCQVYNNMPPDDISKQAVDETRGLVIKYAGSVISANFFSTSSGMTANSGEVWASPDKEFPAADTPYLVATREYTGKDYGGLTNEANAERFFKSMDVTGYDSDTPWFRWNVSMTSAELTASVNVNLKRRYEAAPALIKTLTERGNFRSRPIESIGYLRDLEVTKRGEGGNVMEMRITGSNAVILVETEYNIRALLQPMKNTANGADIVITRKDGSTAANVGLLPSAFFVIEKTQGVSGLDKVTLYGGGYGHGVGMSQNGVRGMIGKGFDFTQILAHYYPGTEIKTIWQNAY
ncbi:MAG: SpoIID/LytB domain-containing protein [Clostridiales bacterium]|jgi:stage II sporulation protein D|nr:SpoIID/LytB domain-containing protein [Clostridiales bacterium]